MRFSRSTLFALLGSAAVFSSHTTSFAAAESDVPETYGIANTLVLDVLKNGAVDIEALQKAGQNVHVKFDPSDANSVELLGGFVRDAAALKSKEAASWSSWWSGVPPLTVLVEPEGGMRYKDDDEDTERCKKDLWAVQTAVSSLEEKMRGQITSWGKGKKDSKPLTFLFSARMPTDGKMSCYENYMTQFPAVQMYVGLNVKEDSEAVQDYSLDKEHRIMMISREWPNSREGIQNHLAAMPSRDAKLNLLNIPLDPTTQEGRFGRRVMEYMGVFARGRLLYPVPSPLAPPQEDDETPVDPPRPPTPTEDVAPPKPDESDKPASPSPLPPSPQPPQPEPVDDEDKKDDKKTDIEDEIDVEPVSPPKPEPSPEDQDGKKDQDGGDVKPEEPEKKIKMEKVQVVAWVIIAFLALGGVWYGFYSMLKGGDASAYHAMEQGNAPNGAAVKA